MDVRSSQLEQAGLEICRCALCDLTCREPRLLPCFHSFCTDCLERYIIKQRESNPEKTAIPCPECCNPTHIQTDGSSSHGKGTSSPPSLAKCFRSDSFVTKVTEVMQARGPDKACDTCHRMGETNSGSDWCVECFDVLCPRCAKAHLYGKATSDHTVMALTQFRELGLGQVMTRSVVHPCPDHVTESVKMYCQDCRKPVCVKCLAEHHRKCQSCLPLDAALDKEENELAELMVKLASMDDVTEDVFEAESGAGILEDSFLKAQDAIKNVASELRKRIDESEKELLDRLYSVSSQLQEKVGDFRDSTFGSRSDDIKTLTSASNRMDALLKYGSSVEILDLFTLMKNIMARVERSRGDVSLDGSSKSYDDDVRLKVAFDVHPNVKTFLQDFESLGEISVDDFKSDEGMSAWGVCVTSQDNVIVVDCRSNKVQKFGISGDLIDHIQISEEPRDVTPCSDDDVAITIMKKQIFVVAVSATMSLKRRIKTQKQYDAISASPSRDAFLVSSLEGKCVDVISTQGDVLKSFGATSDGSSVFESPRFVTYTKEGHYVVSDCALNAVTCISQDGGVVFRYAPEAPHDMKGAQGICSDASGNFFVADFGHSRVRLLNASGEFQSCCVHSESDNENDMQHEFVLGRESGLSRPVAMSISHGNKLVVVQSDGMVKIFGYESMKVKFKGTCWCPRCLDNMEKEKQNGGSGSGSGSGSRSGSVSSQGQGPRSPRMSKVMKGGLGQRSSPTISPLSSTSSLPSPTSSGLSRSSMGSAPDSPQAYRSHRYLT